ncbi:MAG: SBBP repeat-containing protein [bacterium]
MKYCFGVLICFFFSTVIGIANSLGNSTDWLWAHSGGGKGYDQANAIASDSAGNVFVTGFFQDSAVFSGQTIRGTKGRHFFFAKYSSDGSLIWLKSSSQKGQSFGTSLALVEQHNCIVAGYFSDTLTFGSDTLISVGGNNIFVAKIGSNGVPIWAVATGSNSGGVLNGITTDANDNIYITGSFTGVPTFGNTTLHSVGGSDIYICKYTKDGLFQFAKSFGSKGDDVGNGISVGESGSMYFVGTCSDTLEFGSTRIVPIGTSDIFVAKYDLISGIHWAKKAGGLLHGTGSGIVLDAKENVYVAGSFFSSAPPDCDGTGNIYIAKFSKDGEQVWSKCLGSGGEDFANGIATDSAGNIFVVGQHDEAMNFGAVSLSFVNIIDAFIAKFDASGNCTWAENAGSTSSDNGTAVAIDPNGNVYFAGSFGDTMTLSPFVLTNKNLLDVFIAKIGAKLDVKHAISNPTLKSIIFPNPAQQILNMDLQIIPINNSVSIELRTLLGELVLKEIIVTESTSSTRIPMNISGMPSGTYFCIIRCGEFSDIQRVVIER